MPKGAGAARAGGAALLLSYAAFVSLGLPDTVLGLAWPSLRAGFELPHAALGGALSAGVLGYLVSGLAAGRLAAALGVGGLLALSSALVALGLSGLALAGAWPVFLGCAAVVGLGSGAVDAALNTHAAEHFTPRHMNWLHACYSAGATLGPALMTAALAGGSYRSGYAALAVLLAALAAAFLATRRRFDDGPAPARRATGGARAALRHPAVWLQVAIFLVYTGLEATAGQWAFTVLRGRGLGVEAAGAITTAYWASIALGRVAVGFAVTRTGPDRLVRRGVLGAVAGAALYAALPGAAGAFGLVVLGLSLAPVFPMLMSRTPERLGRELAPHAVGFQVAAATLGVAVVPGAHGALADAAGVGWVPAGLLGVALALAALVLLLERATPPPPAAARA